MSKCRKYSDNSTIIMIMQFYKGTLIKADLKKDQLSTMKFTDYIP